MRDSIVQTNLRVQESSVRHVVVDDISPEMVVEMMWRVDAYSRARGLTPQQAPLPSHVRKRLAGSL